MAAIVVDVWDGAVYLWGLETPVLPRVGDLIRSTVDATDGKTPDFFEVLGVELCIARRRPFQANKPTAQSVGRPCIYVRAVSLAAATSQNYFYEKVRS